MSIQEEQVQRYMDGFRHRDHQAILACLTDDVVWRIHGARTTRGKPEFDAEIGAPGFEGSPDLSIERMISSGNTTVITGSGHSSHPNVGPVHFNYCDVLTFRDGLISEVDSYMVAVP
ncbi:nuclear transport factor 2 family protein [Arthrobacter luteolus]|uniref:nuclear transport factor 2 family protein n=1 Tax=Arthrobacter luteolus TaxID=98672 RepID=UPI000AE10A7C|nr:nuclear transport factor 2 family protein [Arthrobacter luteolus]